MGRILIVAGLACVIFGVYRMVTNIDSLLPGGTSAVMALATDPEAREAALCREGETLDESNGQSTYTPGSGFASTVQLYCVNSAGERRDVTGEFAEALTGGVDDIMGGMFTGMPNLLLNVGLIGIGITLLLIGSIVGMLRAARRTVGTPVVDPLTGQTVQGATRVNLNGQDIITTPEIAGRMQQNPMFMGTTTPSVQVKVDPNSKEDLATRLRKLEDLLKANLISQAEYDRLRSELLNTLK